MRIWVKIGVIALAVSASVAIAAPRFIGQGAADVESDLAPGSYARMRDVSLEILERFPPDQYYYVGLGRSPAAVMTFLELYGIEGQTNIPLTGSYISDVDSPEVSERFQKYFQQYLPSEAELRGRKILLIDYFVTGTQLKNTAIILKKMVPEGKLEGYALGHALVKQDFGIPVHQSRAGPNARLSYYLGMAKFDNWAKYKALAVSMIASSPTTPTRQENPDHTSFLNAYRKEMERDFYLKEYRARKDCPANFARLPDVLKSP